MAILEEYFYHGTIRTYSAVFGTLFDGVKIKRGNKFVKVPIRYVDYFKSNQMDVNNPDDENSTKFKMRLPRMSFRLTGFEKDDNRTTTNQNVLMKTDRTKKQYNRVPYTFPYELNIKTKHIEDMLQIIEQILVYFDPKVSVVIKDNPDLEMDSEVVIQLTGADNNFEFTGEYTQTESIECTLTFSLDGWLYKPTSGSNIIKHVTINYHDLSNDYLMCSKEYDENDL